MLLLRYWFIILDLSSMLDQQHQPKHAEYRWIYSDISMSKLVRHHLGWKWDGLWLLWLFEIVVKKILGRGGERNWTILSSAVLWSQQWCHDRPKLSLTHHTANHMLINELSSLGHIPHANSKSCFLSLIFFSPSKWENSCDTHTDSSQECEYSK